MGLADRSLPTKAFARTVNRMRPDANGNINVTVGDLSDVGGTPSDGQTIVYNTTNNTWVLGQTKSRVDNFPITGTGTSVFNLTYPPVTDSWNVKLNGEGVHSSEFSVAFNQLTVTSPADLFLGADTQGSPWDLEVQYDYASRDSGTFARLVAEGADSPVSMPAGVADNDLILAFLFHVDGQPINANGYTLLGTTITSGLSLAYHLDVYAKVRSGGSNTLPTFTDISNRQCLWVVLAERGAASAVATMDSATAAAAGASPAPPTGGAADIRFWAIISTSNTIVPASGTKFLDHTAGSQLNYAAVGDVPTGTLSASLSPAGTAGWAMATVSLA